MPVQQLDDNYQSDDEDVIDDNPLPPQQPSRAVRMEQDYDQLHPLNDWTKIISIEGKPGTGKTRCIHGCIKHCSMVTSGFWSLHRLVFLVSTYRAIFDTSIECNTIHTIFCVPLDNTAPRINYLLANVDVIFIDEVSMVPLDIFRHILTTLQQLPT